MNILSYVLYIAFHISFAQIVSNQHSNHFWWLLSRWQKSTDTKHQAPWQNNHKKAIPPIPGFPPSCCPLQWSRSDLHLVRLDLHWSGSAPESVDHKIMQSVVPPTRVDHKITESVVSPKRVDHKTIQSVVRSGQASQLHNNTVIEIKHMHGCARTPHPLAAHLPTDTLQSMHTYHTTHYSPHTPITQHITAHIYLPHHSLQHTYTYHTTPHITAHPYLPHDTWQSTHTYHATPYTHTTPYRRTVHNPPFHKTHLRTDGHVHVILSVRQKLGGIGVTWPLWPLILIPLVLRGRGVQSGRFGGAGLLLDAGAGGLGPPHHLPLLLLLAALAGDVALAAPTLCALQHWGSHHAVAAFHVALQRQSTTLTPQQRLWGRAVVSGDLGRPRWLYFIWVVIAEGGCGHLWPLSCERINRGCSGHLWPLSCKRVNRGSNSVCNICTILCVISAHSRVFLLANISVTSMCLNVYVCTWCKDEILCKHDVNCVAWLIHRHGYRN